MEENKNNEIEMNSEVKQTSTQQVKTKKKSKVVPILVTIILILVLALALCIGNMYAMTKGYDNVFSMVGSMISGQKDVVEEKNEISEDANIEQENNEKNKSILEDENKGYVYQRECLYSKYILGEIEIPYININSEDAKKVNQEIYEMYEKASKEIKELEDKNPEYYEFTDLSYKYSIVGTMLCVCVDKTPIVVPSGGFVRERIVYNFNLQDGKRMSIQEVLGKFDLTEAKLIEKINLKFKEMYFSGGFDIKEWTTEKDFIEGFEYDINELYFETETITELILDGDAVPYGDYEMILDISRNSLDSEYYEEEQKIEKEQESEKLQDKNDKYKEYIGAWECEGDSNIQLVISDINDEGITLEIISYMNYSYGMKTFKFRDGFNTSAEFHIENGATNTSLGGYIDLVEGGIELRTIGTSNDNNIKSGKIYKFNEKINFEKYVKTWKDSDEKIELKVLKVDHLGMEFELIVEGKSYGIIDRTYDYAHAVGIVNSNLMDEKNKRIANINIALFEDDIRLIVNDVTGQTYLKQGKAYSLKAQ